ncbi:MAG: alpha/beta hydrolase [Cyanobacteria bacterium K_DeepCast_35m_m2_023]|nr:alpha/beta hydrolase [Cyanobacteria bacterium K_DeepCast_35m_m2_023]
MTAYPTAQPQRNRSARRRALAPVALGALLATAAATAPSLAATPSPVRWNTGGAVWTTSADALQTFLTSGEVNDRGLDDGINRSGWTAPQVREGLNKAYSVDLISLSRFLYSDAGTRFLTEHTRSYVPYATLKTQANEALRSAIIADAVDGSISGAGILANLPVDFRLADISATAPLDGAQNVWPRSGCRGDRQCSSLLSWAVFLPANLQAVSQNR